MACGLFFSCRSAARRRALRRSISASGKEGCTTTSAKSPSARSSFSVTTFTMAPLESQSTHAPCCPPIDSNASLISSAVFLAVPCSSMLPKNERSPGGWFGKSPAPAFTTTRTLTMGRSWRSTKRTRTPFFNAKDWIWGGTNFTSAPPAGGRSRNGASGVARGGSSTTTGAGAGAGAGGGRGGGGASATHPTTTPKTETSARRLMVRPGRHTPAPPSWG
jgi:hypothetical protein